MSQRTKKKKKPLLPSGSVWHLKACLRWWGTTYRNRLASEIGVFVLAVQFSNLGKWCGNLTEMTQMRVRTFVWYSSWSNLSSRLIVGGEMQKWQIAMCHCANSFEHSFGYSKGWFCNLVPVNTSISRAIAGFAPIIWGRMVQVVRHPQTKIFFMSSIGS